MPPDPVLSYSAPSRHRWNNLAIISLLLGLSILPIWCGIGLVDLAITGFEGTIPQPMSIGIFFYTVIPTIAVSSVVAGLISLRQIRSRPDYWRGSGAAWTGIVATIGCFLYAIFMHYIR
jgi:hypothetical protein